MRDLNDMSRGMMNRCTWPLVICRSVHALHGINNSDFELYVHHRSAIHKKGVNPLGSHQIDDFMDRDRFSVKLFNHRYCVTGISVKSSMGPWWNKPAGRVAGPFLQGIPTNDSFISQTAMAEKSTGVMVHAHYEYDARIFQVISHSKSFHDSFLLTISPHHFLKYL